MDFVPEHAIQVTAEQYAAEAVACAHDKFKIDLDWSDKSIQDVEAILGHMHERALKDKPTHEAIFAVAQVFGSYIGEVCRRNHGAEWGMLTLNGEQLPGLRCKKSGSLFWPWGKAHNRIEEGPEHNVSFYYYEVKKRCQ